MPFIRNREGEEMKSLVEALIKPYREMTYEERAEDLWDNQQLIARHVDALHKIMREGLQPPGYYGMGVMEISKKLTEELDRLHQKSAPTLLEAAKAYVEGCASGGTAELRALREAVRRAS